MGRAFQNDSNLYLLMRYFNKCLQQVFQYQLINKENRAEKHFLSNISEASFEPSEGENFIDVTEKSATGEYIRTIGEVNIYAKVGN